MLLHGPLQEWVTPPIWGRLDQVDEGAICSNVEVVSVIVSAAQRRNTCVLTSPSGVQVLIQLQQCLIIYNSNNVSRLESTNQIPVFPICFEPMKNDSPSVVHRHADDSKFSLSIPVGAQTKTGQNANRDIATNPTCTLQ